MERLMTGKSSDDVNVADVDFLLQDALQGIRSHQDQITHAVLREFEERLKRELGERLNKELHGLQEHP